MREIHPGLYHWKVYNPYIKDEVDSYLAILDPPVLIDPMEPEGGVDVIRRIALPSHIYLTNRLHDRHCDKYIEAFGATVWCHSAGLHEFQDGSLPVNSFEHGDNLPGGAKALEVGVLCPEETVFHLPIGEGSLAIGDALVRWEGKMGFVPDFLLGDDPPAIKAGIRDRFVKICTTYDFDHLLFAHGDPLIGEGKAALRAFLKTVKDC